MADKVQKVTILKKDLPSPIVRSTTANYLVRYRIVSDDKNRSSHWSPFYNLATQSVTKFTTPDGVKTTGIYVVSVDSNLHTMTVVWTPPADFSKEYDVYVKINSGAWEYRTTQSATNFSATGNNGATMYIAVQIPTNPKQRFENATLFETSHTL
jgi:hypothetical protein